MAKKGKFGKLLGLAVVAAGAVCAYRVIKEKKAEEACDQDVKEAEEDTAAEETADELLKDCDDVQSLD